MRLESFGQKKCDVITKGDVSELSIESLKYQRSEDAVNLKSETLQLKKKKSISDLDVVTLENCSITDGSVKCIKKFQANADLDIPVCLEPLMSMTKSKNKFSVKCSKKYRTKPSKSTITIDHADKDTIKIDLEEYSTAKKKKKKKLESEGNHVTSKGDSIFKDVIVPDPVKVSRPSNRVICKTCLSVFKSEKKLLRHTCKTVDLATIDKSVTFRCFRCNDVFPSSYDLRTHLNKTHSENVICVICDTCNQSFPYRNTLDLHLQVSKECVLKCGSCQKCFRSVYNLCGHINVQHLKSAGYSCLVCDKRFAWKIDLDSHFASAHLDQRPFKCEKCPSTFSHPYSLEEHSERSKCSGLLFPCSHCSKTFQGKNSLYMHMYRVRKKEKEFGPVLKPSKLKC